MLQKCLTGQWYAWNGTKNLDNAAAEGSELGADRRFAAAGAERRCSGRANIARTGLGSGGYASCLPLACFAFCYITFQANIRENLTSCSTWAVIRIFFWVFQEILSWKVHGQQTYPKLLLWSCRNVSGKGRNSFELCIVFS